MRWVKCNVFKNFVAGFYRLDDGGSKWCIFGEGCRVRYEGGGDFWWYIVVCSGMQWFVGYVYVKE